MKRKLFRGRETALQQCDAELRRRGRGRRRRTAREQSLQEAAYLTGSTIAISPKLKPLLSFSRPSWRKCRTACGPLESDGKRGPRAIRSSGSRAQHIMDELEKQHRTVQRHGEHVDRCRVSMEQLRRGIGAIAPRDAGNSAGDRGAGCDSPAPPRRHRSSNRWGESAASWPTTTGLPTSNCDGEKEKLQKIHDQLLVQHEILEVQQKHQFEQWAAARQDELEKRTSRLVAREQQVERREAELHESCCQFSS